MRSLVLLVALSGAGPASGVQAASNRPHGRPTPLIRAPTGFVTGLGPSTSRFRVPSHRVVRGATELGTAISASAGGGDGDRAFRGIGTPSSSDTVPAERKKKKTRQRFDAVADRAELYGRMDAAVSSARASGGAKGWREALGTYERSFGTGVFRQPAVKDEGSWRSVHHLAIEASEQLHKWPSALRALDNHRADAAFGAPAPQTWALVISACGNGRAVNEALATLDMASAANPDGADGGMYLAACAACARVGRWRDALSLLNQLKAKPSWMASHGLNAYHAAITACGRGGEWRRALDLLHEARAREGGDKDNEGGGGPARFVSLLTYTASVDACARAGYWRQAIETMDEGRRAGFPPDKITYTAAIVACARGHNSRRALELLEAMVAEGVRPDVVTYTAAIDACAKAGDPIRAFELLDEMRASDDPACAPNGRTYAACVSACGRSGDFSRAFELLEHMRRLNHPIDRITYNAIISACEKARPPEWKRALAVVEEMDRVGVTPDAASFSGCIAACGAAGELAKALELLDSMQERGGPMAAQNLIAFSAAIAACARAGEWQRAVGLLDAMEAAGISPDLIAYNSAAHACLVGANPDAALALWARMRGKGVAPDIITATEVLGVVERAGFLYRDRADGVFAQCATEHGLVFSSLDAEKEIDLSGLTLPVARCAVRFSLARLVGGMDECLLEEGGAAAAAAEECTTGSVVFITGAGRRHRGNRAAWLGREPGLGDGAGATLRECILEMLATELGLTSARVDREAPGQLIVPERALMRFVDQERALAARVAEGNKGGGGVESEPGDRSSLRFRPRSYSLSLLLYTRLGHVGHAQRYRRPVSPEEKHRPTPRARRSSRRYPGWARQRCPRLF